MNEKQRNILNATITIIKDHGVERLTLDAAAKEAGISKGGLLYYFPSKDALLSGMFHYLNDQFNKDMESKVTSLPQQHGKRARAYLEQVQDDIKVGNNFGQALIAALFANPDLLLQLQEQYKDWQQQIENDGMDIIDATIIRLVADGIWFSEILNLGKLQQPLLEQVIARTLQWTESEDF
ncbi:TetR/AcrR family transcriptional regulator [Paenibacillus yanchengensis]|uniref:TetR/AcrR family transcriptional regulator n=1 Tax=Paenibacillus yanchengensis TaxID=2035833 RepID=A0ABW4YQ83_9BACL